MSITHECETVLSWQFNGTETASRGRHVVPCRTHYSNSEPVNLCSFFFMMRAWRSSNKYQLYILWFDPTGARTHDLLHSMRAR